MFRTLAEPLDNYLQYFSRSNETGLIILNDQYSTAKTLKALKNMGFALAYSWRGILHNLALNQSVVFFTNQMLNQCEFELISQYQNNRGVIQLIDQDSNNPISVICNPESARLLIVVNEIDLPIVEATHELVTNVGLIEYI